MADESNGQCIAMYVRRADKGQEMRLVSFSDYAEAAELLWEGGYMNNSRRNNNISNISNSNSSGSSSGSNSSGSSGSGKMEVTSIGNINDNSTSNDRDISDYNNKQ